MSDWYILTLVYGISKFYYPKNCWFVLYYRLFKQIFISYYNCYCIWKVTNKKQLINSSTNILQTLSIEYVIIKELSYLAKYGMKYPKRDHSKNNAYINDQIMRYQHYYSK